MRPTEPTACDDEELVTRALAGERQAFGELVRRHQRAALRVAAVISGSTEEADDIVQEAFVKAHRGLAGYRASGSVRSWMLRVVANHAKNHVRGRVRRRRRDDRHARLHVRVEPGADDAALRRADHQAVADALGRLRPAERAVLGCRFVADLSELETSEVLGIPVGTVKSRTSRALARLRVELDTPERTS